MSSTSVLPSYNASIGRATSPASPFGASQAAHSETPPNTPPETTSTQTLESNQSVPEGYPALAVEMCAFPELAIFRRFGALNAQALLYMQAEIQELELRLREIQAGHGAESGEEQFSLVDWFFLRHSENTRDEWQLVNEMRIKLKEYNEALIQQYHILRMAPPGNRDMRCLRSFLDPLLLNGKDSRIWGSLDEPEACAKDLVALLSRPSEDPVSTWVTEKAVDKLRHFKCAQSKELAADWGRKGFNERSLYRVTGMITNVVASALPILSIASLYSVKPLGSRLAIIAGLNFILSICLAAFTRIRRAEVFAVAAAFSAIQVVFVQVDSNN